MNKPSQIPDAVREAIKRFNEQHPSAHIAVDSLQWDTLMGCYYFHRGTVFHGVELDGHIHT